MIKYIEINEHEVFRSLSPKSTIYALDNYLHRVRNYATNRHLHLLDDMYCLIEDGELILHFNKGGELTQRSMDIKCKEIQELVEYHLAQMKEIYKNNNEFNASQKEARRATYLKLKEEFGNE